MCFMCTDIFSHLAHSQVPRVVRLRGVVRMACVQEYAASPVLTVAAEPSLCLGVLVIGDDKLLSGQVFYDQALE